MCATGSSLAYGLICDSWMHCAVQSEIKSALATKYKISTRPGVDCVGNCSDVEQFQDRLSDGVVTNVR